MNALFRVRDDCRLCHSRSLDLAAPLGEMSVATPNFKVAGVDRNAPVFRTAVPLELYHCRDCGHLQILHIGNPEIQYRDYVYTTSISLGLREHFKAAAARITKKRRLSPSSFVVEIGSNDGTLLRNFKEQGMRVLGIDPAVEIAGRATHDGVETLPEFFNEDLGSKISQKHGAADVIIANNMIANVDDLDDFVKGVTPDTGARRRIHFRDPVRRRRHREQPSRYDLSRASVVLQNPAADVVFQAIRHAAD